MAIYSIAHPSILPFRMVFLLLLKFFLLEMTVVDVNDCDIRLKIYSALECSPKEAFCNHINIY